MASKYEEKSYLLNKSQIVTNLSAMPVLLEVLSSDQNALLLQGGLTARTVFEMYPSIT